MPAGWGIVDLQVPQRGDAALFDQGRQQCRARRGIGEGGGKQPHAAAAQRGQVQGEQVIVSHGGLLGGNLDGDQGGATP
jgi:hypothetical protein